MNETLVTLRGYVGSPVKLRPAGESVVGSFRLGCTPRTYHRSSDTWVDEPTQWFTVQAWRGLGENCEASLQTGDAVMVQGRLRLNTWANADGVEQQSWEVIATAVGHDLNRGRTRFFRPPRPEEQAADRSADGSAGAPDESPAEAPAQAPAEAPAQAPAGQEVAA